ncbi:hypothetical protein Golob_024209, partial [Gossypium lobatum]|nr:hypothetical protein [Gossypium lobatum]
DNAAVRVWSEKIQQEKGDSLAEGYTSELWDFTLISVDKHLFRALAHYWNPAYSCFTFGKVDLEPTIEEYTRVLRNLVLAHPDTKKKVDVFALGIYGLVIFPKALRYIDENLQDEDVKWRAPWMIPNEILFRCGDFNWVLLLGIWGAIGYAPLLMSRQYRSRHFIPATQGLAQCEFAYKDDNYKKKRVNDNILLPNQEIIRSLEEHLQVIPSELEIIKQDFEKRNLELGKKIEQLEERKMQLGLDIDLQKLEADKLRKGKNKAKEDLDSLKTDYKKLSRSIRTACFGKTSEQWR